MHACCFGFHLTSQAGLNSLSRPRSDTGWRLGPRRSGGMASRKVLTSGRKQTEKTWKNMGKHGKTWNDLVNTWEKHGNIHGNYGNDQLNFMISWRIEQCSKLLVDDYWGFYCPIGDYSIL